MGKFLASGTHLGSTNINHQMSPYVYKRKPDGIHIINLRKTWEKIVLAARIIAGKTQRMSVSSLQGLMEHVLFSNLPISLEQLPLLAVSLLVHSPIRSRKLSESHVCWLLLILSVIISLSLKLHT